MPDGHRGPWKGDPIMPREQLEKAYIEKYIEVHTRLKEKGSKDLFVFNKHILHAAEGGGKVPLAQFHRDLCTFVTERRDRKKLILVPRGHLKSTMVTVGYSLFRICEDINVRILILNATWQMAVDFLAEIKGHLQKNEKLIELFGNLAENPVEWAQDRITLQRTDQGKKGPTIWAAGIDTNLVGSHPDLIILDDVVNRDNSMSQEMMEKVILRYKDALDLLEPGGQLIVVGTMWNDSDLYNWILNPDNRIMESYDLFKKPAFESDFPLGEVFADNGEVLMRDRLWPEKFSYKELADRYREQGPYHFSAQYLLNPVPAEDANFKRQWFQYSEVEDWRGRWLSTYMTIDPAISTEKEADFTAVVITWVDPQGDIFVRHTERVKVKPNELIDLIFTLSEQYHPKAIGLEVVSFQKTLQYAIKEEMGRRSRYLPLVELKTQDRSKAERIQALQPLYANGKIFHNKGDKNLETMESELLRFPRSLHDDLADALAMQLELVVPPRPKTSRYHHQYLYG